MNVSFGVMEKQTNKAQKSKLFDSFEEAKFYAEKFGGTIERWDAAEKALGDALLATGYKFEIAEGEGAFYAPKLEFHL